MAFSNLPLWPTLIAGRRPSTFFARLLAPLATTLVAIAERLAPKGASIPRAWVAAAFACAALQACGGGGGGVGAVVGGGDAGITGAGTFAPNALSLLAGNIGGPGSLDGTGAAARFNTPSAVAFDAAGNAYIADTGNHTIRKVSPSFAVTTLAGMAGVAGSADGQGTAARFSSPGGIAVDAVGNVFVADTGNHTLRKIDSAGRVTTFAGAAGTPGATDGIGSAARFNSPSGVVVDGHGGLYVADTNNLTIRHVDALAGVTTIAGVAGSAGSVDGQGTAARFNGPHAIALEPSGNVVVADTWHFPQSHTESINSTIRRVTATGVVTTIAGLAGTVGADDGTGSAARFYYPAGLAVDPADNIYVADTYNASIRRIAPGGIVSTLAGGTGGSADGTGTSASFFYPAGIAIDPRGNLLVADTGNATLRMIDASLAVTTVAGLATAYGAIDGSGSVARFNGPYGVASDGAGNVYVADSFNATIRRISSSGQTTTFAGLAGQFGSADGTRATALFNAPYGVAVDAQGNVFVADTGNSVIRKIDPSGHVSTLAGLAGQTGGSDGQGALARFNQPYGIAVRADGSLLVADTLNHAIRRVAPDGSVSTLAGAAGVSGAADGPGQLARFNLPYGIALAADGTAWIADSGNQTVRKLTPDGTVVTVAGLVGVSGSADGVASTARFNSPQGIAIATNGDVLIADALNATLRRLSPASAAVRTVAGVAGEDGILTGTLPARLYRPFGVTVRPDGVVAVTSGNSVLALTGL